jgi:hypothetical protein
VTLAGPSQFSSAGTLTWTASASDGTGTYSYQWKYRPFNSTTWTTFGGTSASASRYVYSTTPSFIVRVTVTSGGVSTSVDRTVYNTNDDGGSDCGTQRVCD